MVRIKRAGAWALGGHRPVELEVGQEADFGPADNTALVEAGWAEYVTAKAESKADKPANGRQQQTRRSGGTEAQ